MSLRWGIVSTIKAPLEQIQRFAAWHLEQGAHRLYLYLDDGARDLCDALNQHPKIRATATDDTYWAKRKGRPEKHQQRQSLNARHANNRRVEVDWLAHIDVDEFLIPSRPIDQVLADLPANALCARTRPIEALAPVDDSPATCFKAFPLDQAQRQQAAEACFPQWGAHLSGGFLSHVAGKLFFRPGTKGLQIKIHNVILNGAQNPGQQPLPDIELGHFHADGWDHFITAYRFRLAQGSYRAELKPQARSPGALNLHDLLTQIESHAGQAGLRAFFHEVCTATPALCDRLSQQGLLRRHDLRLPQLRQKHFGAL